MNTIQFVEQDEIVIEKADSSSECKVEVRYVKYDVKQRQYIVKAVKQKKAKKILTPEMKRERNRDNARKYRDRKKCLKEQNNPKPKPKPKPLTAAQLSKRYRDKKNKNQKKI